MSSLEWSNYYKELEDAKNDIYLYVKNDLRLTLTHIIKQFNLPTDPYSNWVFQHWQAIPKPIAPYPDQREFGYFIQGKGSLTYKTLPAELITIDVGVKIIPLQYRKPATPKRIPVAGNYFPNSIISVIEGKYVLHNVRSRYENE